MAETRNKADYDSAVVALQVAGGDTSKLSSHERNLVSAMTTESSSNGNAVRDLVSKHSRTT